jgi:hypothetical protein
MTSLGVHKSYVAAHMSLDALTKKRCAPFEEMWHPHEGCLPLERWRPPLSPSLTHGDLLEN